MNYIASDKSTIFGNTQDGVPNPVVPHVHEYPTRFHGSVWRYVDVSKPRYISSPYMVNFRKSVSDFGAADFISSLTGSPTGGSSVMDFLVGGLVGYAVAPDDKTRVVWGIAGGALTAVLGVIGMIGTAGAAIYVKR